MITFREFLNQILVKPQMTLLNRKINSESGLKTIKDMSKPNQVVEPRLKKAVKFSSSIGPISSISKRQRLTKPENRFKIRGGSNLDITS